MSEDGIVIPETPHVVTSRTSPPYAPPEAGCSFCGKVCPDVRYMIQGPLVTICDECVFLCVKILGELGIVDADAAPPLRPMDQG